MQTHFRNKIQHKSLHVCIIIKHKGWNTWKLESVWLYFPINKNKCTSIHICMPKGQIAPLKSKKSMSIFRHMTSGKIFASILTLHFRLMPLLFTIIWILQINHNLFMWTRVWFIYRKCIDWDIKKKRCVSGSSDRVVQCVSVRINKCIFF